MANSACFILLVFLSLPVHAQVYHCKGPAGPVYSQMPCAEDAERLTDYDPVVKRSAGSDSEQGQGQAVVSQEQSNTMEHFVATLQKQRQQQMSELDQNIAQMQSQLDSDQAEDRNESDHAALAAELAALISERESVSEQYTALIAEAERRAGSAEGTH